MGKRVGISLQIQGQKERKREGNRDGGREVCVIREPGFDFAAERVDVRPIDLNTATDRLARRTDTTRNGETKLNLSEIGKQVGGCGQPYKRRNERRNEGGRERGGWRWKRRWPPGTWRWRPQNENQKLQFIAGTANFPVLARTVALLCLPSIRDSKWVEPS